MFLGVLVFMLEVSKFDYFYELLEVCKNFLGIFAHSAMVQVLPMSHRSISFEMKEKTTSTIKMKSLPDQLVIA